LVDLQRERMAHKRERKPMGK